MQLAVVDWQNEFSHARDIAWEFSVEDVLLQWQNILL